MPTLDLLKSKYSYKKNLMLLGCPVAPLTLEETILEIHKIIQTRTPHQHCVVNAGKMVLMHRDPLLRDIVKNCCLINADGQSVVWALQLKGGKIPERVTGIDIMERLFREAHEKKYRVFFLGSTQEIIDSVLKIVTLKFPSLVIAGSHHGYFNDSDNPAIVSQVAQSKADILFVAMGSPKKEYWLFQNLEKLNVPFCMGVGGSFDVLAGKAKRAPLILQRMGMEWFYRFIQEPRRLWRRYLLDNLIFSFLVFLDIFKIRILLKSESSQELKDKEIT
ncbi:MAG: WecB/TagA/CpsF family glycosyltransferase [Elusimicrobiota bacterium]